MSNTTLIILVLIVAAAALLLLRRAKGQPAPNRAGEDSWTWPDQLPAEQRPVIATPTGPTGPSASAVPTGADVDGQVLEQLRAAGSDLSKPHPLEFYLYFPTVEQANKAADRIAADGERVEVRRAPTSSAWMCYVTKRMVPKKSEISALGKRFRALADEFGGEYDGWETEVVQ